MYAQFASQVLGAEKGRTRTPRMLAGFLLKVKEIEIEHF
jgi:hypothetical protein